LGLVLLAGGLSLAPAAAAAPTGPSVLLTDAPKIQTLRKAATTTVTSPRLVRSTRSPAATRPPVSTWEVTYTGFESNSQARQSFQAAVDTWAGLVASSVPIKVSATFKDLGDPNILGQAGPTDFVVLDRDRNGTRDTAYPVALANALSRADVSPPSSRSSGNDIDAEFNNRAVDIYYGTDGAAPRGFVDFQTVVLHELGHGLGFLGSMDVDSSGIGSFGSGTPFPDIYDRFTVLSQGAVQGKPLLSFPNNSSALGQALTSGGVYWDGALGKAAYNGRPPRLFAPEKFQPASSFSHLSDADFPPTDVDSLMTPFVENNEVIHEPGPIMLGMFADLGWSTPPLPGVRFTPIDPVRVLDTINGIGTPVRRLGPGGFLDVHVAGVGGVPNDAKAVVLNLTGVGPTSATDLRAYPTPRTGTAQPQVSNLNLASGEIRANLVTVPVGESGRVRILNSGGTTHVLGDLSGWYGETASSAYHPIDPVRLMDTRGAPGSEGTPLPAGQPRDVVVTGMNAVPASATAVILTVTALNSTSTTDVRVYPTPADGSAPPQVSNINLRPPGIVPNLVISKVGSGGSVRLLNSAGSVDVLVDIAGWYDTADGALFHVLAPKRILDTRTSAAPKLVAGETRDLTVLGVAGVPAQATAVVLNVTGVGATRTTDVAVYPNPGNDTVPLVSNLNLLRGQTNADLVVSGVGVAGQVRLRNSGGELALVADVAGWFGP